MQDRRSILILFYDVPMTTKKEQKRYREFRKFLVQNGYIRVQESVYIKLQQSTESFDTECARIFQHTDEGGNIRVLNVPLAMFERMKTIRGEKFNFSRVSDAILLF